MFRIGLLATTALVIAGSLSLFAAQSVAIARSPILGPERDRNSEFLSTYGPARFSVYALSGSYSVDSQVSSSFQRQYVAVPITGNGRTVHRIVVKEQGSYTREFSAGIYSNTPSGLPGKLIAGGTGTARKKHLMKVNVPIAPTKLQRNTIYWIEEMVRPCLRHRRVEPQQCENVVYWKQDPYSKRKAYVRDVSYYRETSHSTPWMEQSGGPYVNVE